MKKRVDNNCQAFRTAVEVLSRPWSAAILSSLQEGDRRFTELAGGCEGVTDKVLSAHLKDLEARGLVVRHVDPGPPVRVSYSLTDAGRSFGNVAAAIHKWGMELVAPKKRAKSA